MRRNTIFCQLFVIGLEFMLLTTLNDEVVVEAKSLIDRSSFQTAVR
jgi:hypothetical protein